MRYKKKESRNIQGVCVRCSTNLQTCSGHYNGIKIYKPICSACNKQLHRRDGKYSYKRYKKDCCEKCGFKAEHPCQLDVDHIDGNSKNNNISNLMTLCANCHRLKTVVNKDYLPSK